MELHQQIARKVRKNLLEMHARSGASHIGSALSCVEILVALYFSVMRVFPEDPQRAERDRFILSKGHAASGLYAILAARGLMEKSLLEGFHMDGGKLSGHPDRLAVPFVEVSTGSLGHGLPVGVGMAYALKLNGNNARVFCLMSDGEIQEGSVWEAANQAHRLELDRLTAIVDANGLQCFERTDRIMQRSSYARKWEAFGWSVVAVDGHDIAALVAALNSFPSVPGKPSIVIADTVKGKGISAFEDRLEWHFRSPAREDLDAYCQELDAQSICKDAPGTRDA